MSCEEYIVGQKPRFAAEFRLGNVLTDPTTVKAIVQKPSASAPTVYTYGVNAELVRTAVGKYHIEPELTEGGLWKVRIESSGTVVAAYQTKFRVLAESPVG